VSGAGDSAAMPPQVIPVFPLAGCLLLPGNWLPLNVFEPRYRAMVEDVMTAERVIGIIQPLAGVLEEPLLLEDPDHPDLYGVGCAGAVARCEPQADGRYLVLLHGSARFRVQRELALLRGYRRVVASYAEFERDLAEQHTALDPRPVLAALEAFSATHRFAFDLEMLAALPGVSLVNGLAAALPFRPEEKQALLEASDPAARQELLLTLMELSAPPSATGSYAPPTVH
jgi:Lon protease-like protein